MTLSKIAVAGLYQRLARTLITQVAVAVAVALVTVSLSASFALDAMVEGTNVPRIHTVSASPNIPMPLAYVERIRAVLTTPTKIEWQQGYGRSLVVPEQPNRYIVWGVSDGYPLTHSPHLFKLPPDVHSAWLADKQGLLLSSDLNERLKWKPGQRLNIPMKFGDVAVHVTGVLEGAGEFVLLHYEYMDQLAKEPIYKGVQRIVTPCARAEMDALALKIDALFDDSASPTMSLSEHANYEPIFETIAAVPRLIVTMGWLVAFITILITASTITITVRERRGDYATLRAIGFRRARIMRLIVIESVVLCVPGGIVGTIVPYLAFGSAGINMGAGIGAIAVSLQACGIVVIGAAVLGFLIAIVPAMNAARLDVIQALQE